MKITDDAVRAALQEYYFDAKHPSQFERMRLALSAARRASEALSEAATVATKPSEIRHQLTVRVRELEAKVAELEGYLTLLQR